MLTIQVPIDEGFDNETQKFVVTETFELVLEHSLVSISKWESKFQKPFLGPDEKTSEEMQFYLDAMCLSPDVPPGVWYKLSAANTQAIKDYIDSSQTATTFRETGPSRSSGEIITAELIYYWMVALEIPFECQHWHLNRLLTLVKVCNLKNQPAKKMSRQSAAKQQRDLNAKRRAQLGSAG